MRAGTRVSGVPARPRGSGRAPFLAKGPRSAARNPHCGRGAARFVLPLVLALLPACTSRDAEPLDPDRRGPATSAPGAVAVVDGMLDGRCVSDSLVTVDPSFVQTLVAVHASESCPAEIALFDRDHASRLLVLGGPSEESEVAAEGVPLVISLSVWILTSAVGAEDDVRQDVRHASSLARANRMGVRFVVGEVHDPATLGVTGLQQARSIIGNGCDQAEALANAGPPYLRADRINVYVVDQVKLGNLVAFGYNCFEFGAPHAVYLSFSGHHEATLLHEFGHALMLRDDFAASKFCGHVGWMATSRCPDIGSDNVMWDVYENPENYAEVRMRFTVGQVYRMNVDERSWLNVSGIRSGQPARSCQDECFTGGCKVASPCPRIGLDTP